jgi:hypothetical protein
MSFEDGGVVDQNVQSAVLANHGFDKLAAFSGVSDVGLMQRVRIASQRIKRRFGSFAVGMKMERHARSIFSKLLGDGSANSASRAGYQNDFAVKTHPVTPEALATNSSQ